MSVRVFAGNARVAALEPSDRGFAYGDGLFETMRAHQGEVRWWDAHWERLHDGAERLGIALPDPQQVRREAADLLGGADAVLKLLVTRGSGGRGYALPADAATTWMLARHPLPPAAPKAGIAVRWCETRLAIQPALAGLKHCNRLEQVLARAEWLRTGEMGIDEGLMRSIEGDVVSATAANLFVLRDGAWITPAIDRCGVAGVCRRWVMAAAEVAQARLSVTEVETAEAVFLCNAVRGILPVARLGARTWALHPRIAALQTQLAAANPALVAV